MKLTPLQRNTLVILLLSFISLFIYIIKDMLIPLFLACILSIIFYPLYKNIKKRIHSHNYASLITLLIISIAILLPLISIIYWSYQEAYFIITKLKLSRYFRFYKKL